MIQVGPATPLETWENEGGASGPAALADERRDRAGFLARLCPQARRHDHVPLAAYVEYLKARAPVLSTSDADPPEERSRP